MELQELHSKLAVRPNYVGMARAGVGLCWKTVNREHVLVKDQAADPLLDPIQLVMVAQLSRGGANLKPLGSYSAQFNNLAKAKISFELEMPRDGVFAGDYLRAVALLRKLEKNALPALESRNLLVDASAHSHVRMVASLFREKTDDDDEEDIPDGAISHDPANEAYFPTSTNWPMTAEQGNAVATLQASHVFQPMHVVDVTDKYVDPALFAKRLPGALVQVFFTLRYWSFKAQNFNSFSAQVDHVVVLQESVRTLTPALIKPKARRVSAHMWMVGDQPGRKRAAEDEATVPDKRQRGEDVAALSMATSSGSSVAVESVSEVEGVTSVVNNEAMFKTAETTASASCTEAARPTAGAGAEASLPVLAEAANLENVGELGAAVVPVGKGKGKRASARV